jgi:non-specific serine/threonine protein kinase
MTTVEQPVDEVGPSSTAPPAVRQADPGAFLGRAEELDFIRRLIVGGGIRLLTLTGPAGVGKTRLALEVGKRLGGLFPDGVRFVDLTTIDDPAEVPSALAESLGLPDAGPTPVIERLSAWLRARKILVILDNFEQVLSAAPLLDTLLRTTAALRLIVTSREPLHLWVEQTLPVPPLELPDPEHLPSLETLADVASVAMFLQRARMINPTFRLTDENARAVAELCVRLDGLPLAIELAAARAKVLSPQMLLDRLAQRLSLLHWEAKDLPVRQHTLRAAIGWSYELLTVDEQALFRFLAIFVGGFTMEAAEAVLSHQRDRTVGVLEGVASLVDKSLVQSEDDGEGGLRFRLLESVRAFALEQMSCCAEGDAAGRAHAHYFLELAERADPELVGSAQREWFLRLEMELGNLRAALRWLQDHGENERALRLAAAMGHFWEVRGYLREGEEALEDALARVPDADPRLRARVLTRLGSILISQGDAEGSRLVLEDALALGRALEDADLIARALGQLGRRLDFLCDTEEGMREAIQLLEEALTLRKQMGDKRDAAYIQMRLAWIALGRGAYDEVHTRAQDALATYREAGDDAGATVPLLLLGLTEGKRGDAARAACRVRKGLETSRRLQDRRLLLLVCNVVLWWLPGERRLADRLAMILGAAESLEEATTSMSASPQQAWTLATIKSLQTCLGMKRFATARCEGRGLSFSQIGDLIALLLSPVEVGGGEAAEPRDSLRKTRVDRFHLSKREIEVLRLLAEGLSNMEIASRLILSENTVKTHITSIYNKLGVDSRVRAVAVATSEGLVESPGGQTVACS